jgi:dTDP-4-amino-4,6-dideoxygalactose transaminase
LLSKHGLTQWFELPYHAPEAGHVWNQYGIRVHSGLRDAMRRHLTEMGIGNEVYYPVPLHQQECFRELGYATGSLPETETASAEILHLPIYPELTESEQDTVIEGIKRFYASATLRRAA